MKEQPFMQIISSSTDIENQNPKPSLISDKPLKPKPKRKPKRKKEPSLLSEDFTESTELIKSDYYSEPSSVQHPNPAIKKAKVKRFRETD